MDPRARELIDHFGMRGCWQKRGDDIARLGIPEYHATQMPADFAT